MTKSKDHYRYMSYLSLTILKIRWKTHTLLKSKKIMDYQHSMDTFIKHNLHTLLDMSFTC